jgi:hypothetical protein
MKKSDENPSCKFQAAFLIIRIEAETQWSACHGPQQKDECRFMDAPFRQRYHYLSFHQNSTSCPFISLQFSLKLDSAFKWGIVDDMEMSVICVSIFSFFVE